MKKTTLLLISFLAIASYVYGQQGGILLYGDASISSLKTDNGSSVEKANTFVFAPGIGYGICKNFILGINIGYSSTKNSDPNETIKTNLLAVGPFVRYVKPITDIFDFRTQLNLNYLSGHTKDINTNTSGSENTTKNVLTGFDVALMPSIGIHAGKHWGIDLGYGALGYQSTKEHPDNGNPGDDIKTKKDQFLLQINYFSSFYWGISYMFGGGKEAK